MERWVDCASHFGRSWACPRNLYSPDFILCLNLSLYFILCLNLSLYFILFPHHLPYLIICHLLSSALPSLPLFLLNPPSIHDIMKAIRAIKVLVLFIGCALILTVLKSRVVSVDEDGKWSGR